MIEYNVLIIW